MAEDVESGDYVIIEFGHNDGGSLSTDNGRTDCEPVDGDYATTCETVYNGVAETVQTYYTYLVNAAELFQDKGANVIISSPTPNNVWEGGSYSWSPSRFVEYAQVRQTASLQRHNRKLMEWPRTLLRQSMQHSSTTSSTPRLCTTAKAQRRSILTIRSITLTPTQQVRTRLREPLFLRFRRPRARSMITLRAAERRGQVADCCR